MPKLSLLTLNLHCLEEMDLEIKQQQVSETILQKDIDIILFQEVAQYSNEEIIIENIKPSNYGYAIQQQLQQLNKQYYYYFEPIKSSFNKYDEGVAILSKYPLHDVTSNYISKTHEYKYWRTRKMLKGDLNIHDNVFSIVTVHTGWTDKYEIFEDQIDRLVSHVDLHNTCIFAGDFNVRPNTDEYNYILSKKLIDVIPNTHELYNYPTHIEDMDIHKGSTRIDYFFTNQIVNVVKTEILFEDVRVSDHNGVYIELKIK